MKRIFYLLVSLVSFVFLSTITYAETFPQAIVVPVTVNANNCTVSFDSEDNNADFDFNITSPLCNITNTSNTFTFSKQVSMLLIRNVSCGETNIENLTKQCVELFSQVDYIGNYTRCTEGKARLEEGYDFLQNDYESKVSQLFNVSTNFTQCSDALNNCKTDSVKRGEELTKCYQDKSAESVLKEQYKKERITFTLIGSLAAIGLYMFFTKRRNPKDAFPEQQNKIMNPEIRDVMEEKLGRKSS